MNQPQAFADTTKRSHRKWIEYALSTYLPLIRWKSGANVVDIGCGLADVTVDVLLPSLPTNYKQLFGVDQSVEAIEYAREKYATKPVDFMVVDIQAEKLPSELNGKFDHIFSFLCLQNVINQRQCFTNLNSMLKLGGDMLLTFIAYDQFNHSYEAMYKSEKWRKHMVGYDKHASPYFGEDDPVKKLRNILESTEFTIKVCKIIDWYIPHQDREKVKHFMTVDFIGENLRDDFMEDAVERMINKFDCINRRGDIAQFCKMFVVIAEKKKNLL